MTDEITRQAGQEQPPVPPKGCFERGKKMKALVLKEVNRFEYTDVPEPEYGADDVLIDVKAVSICGSDVHGYDGGSGRRRPPVIMGHEAAGVICATGANVTAWKAGDRVTFDSTEYCGKCYYCKKGLVNLCENRKVLGVSCEEYNRAGAMAEKIAVPERILYKLPDNVSYAEAAMVEPLSIAAHAYAMSGMKLSDKVVVVGSGTIGLLITQVVRAAGASELIVVDIDDSRLEIAKKLGATAVINSREKDAAAAVYELTGGRGADLAFEACGLSVTLNTAIDSVRVGGRVVMVGNVSKTVEMPLQKCVTRQIDLQGTCASAGEYDMCLDMISHGMVDVGSITSKIAPLSEGQEWFDRLHAAEKGLIKVVLEP